MKNYESLYEEYKNTLLRDKSFRHELTDLYRCSLRVERDYIDENGVLWKMGLLGAVCGFLITFTPVENGNWFLGILLFLGIIFSIIWARHIGKKFKKKSAERKFYTLQYNKHFKARVQKDKEHDAKKFAEDFYSTVVFMRRCANNPGNTRSEVIDEFRCALRYVEELEEQYKDISTYDHFAEKLMNDWYFNAEIQKDIDKYI